MASRGVLTDCSSEHQDIHPAENGDHGTGRRSQTMLIDVECQLRSLAAPLYASEDVS
jgi:hypothetical protein